MHAEHVNSQRHVVILCNTITCLCGLRSENCITLLIGGRMIMSSPSNWFSSVNHTLFSWLGWGLEFLPPRKYNHLSESVTGWTTTSESGTSLFFKKRLFRLAWLFQSRWVSMQSIGILKVVFQNYQQGILK